MAETDRRGLALTTRSSEAAAHHRTGSELFLRGQPGARTAFAGACAADPRFCEGYVGQAFSALYDGDTESAARHLAAADTCDGDPRALGQLALVRALSQLDMGTTDRLATPHLTEYPCDELAREAAGLLFFLLGRSRQIIDLYDWLAPLQGDDWGFAASWSFACHEVGRLDESRSLGEAALSARPDHALALHSLAHVAYESGRHAEGADMIRSFFSAHDTVAFQRRHLHWHLALHLLATGHDAEAASLWAVVSPHGVPTLLGAVEDGASLMWRWHLYGLDGWQLPWEELSEQAHQMAALPVIPLPAACAAVVLAALDDEDGLALLLSTARSMQSSGLPVPADVLSAVADAARASFAGAWGDVAGALLAARPQFGLIGGSRAQREVFEDALVFGLLRSGRADEAVPLLEERLHRRSSGRDDALLHAAAR
jgi:tetratricopeptide (TPR) repeat protein